MTQTRELMSPLPALASYARRVTVAAHEVTLFLYDTEPAARDGIPHLLVHGLGDEADTWRHVLPALARRRRVLALDLPGFGRSDKPAAPYTVPWYAAVVSALLDTLQIRRVALVGHSLGAMTCHWLALEQPTRVEALVLLAGGLATTPRRPDLNTLLLLTPRLGEWLYSQLRKNPQAAYDSLRPFYADLDALPPAEQEFLFRRVNERVWNDDQRRAFFRTVRGLASWLPRQQKGLSDRLAHLTTPTTVLWGAQDRVVTVEHGRDLAARQPSAHLTVLAGAGHNLQQEQPEAVVAAIEDALSAAT